MPSQLNDFVFILKELILSRPSRRMRKIAGFTWIYLYKFETIHGSSDQQSDVLLQCKNAEPRHGELWCKYSKDIKNWKQKADFFLLKAAKEIEIPT